MSGRIPAGTNSPVTMPNTHTIRDSTLSGIVGISVSFELWGGCRSRVAVGVLGPERDEIGQCHRRLDGLGRQGECLGGWDFGRKEEVELRLTAPDPPGMNG